MKPVRILFVDDEPNILQGLRRALRPRAGAWEMAYAASAAEALGLLEKQPFDVVASDLQMPGVDGAALLGEVKRRWPTALRIVLSGSSEEGSVMRTVHEAHQYVSKPCDVAVLTKVVDRAMKLRALVTDPALAEFVSGIQHLPSLPDLYGRIHAALQDESLSVHDIGDLITQDVALSTKVLQVVNSAFFALPRRVASPGDAAVVLGIDVLRGIVLGQELFTSMDDELGKAAGMEQLWQHSLRVAGGTRVLAKSLGSGKHVADTAFLAGIVHEVGRLIFLMNRPDEYLACKRACEAKPRDALAIERERLGTLHELACAYLLGTWGLPDDVVTAVAWHRRPGESGVAKVDALCLLHVTDALATCAATPGSPGFDTPWLDNLGLADRLPKLTAELAAAAG